jgi:hypothetical protein
MGLTARAGIFGHWEGAFRVVVIVPLVHFAWRHGLPILWVFIDGKGCETWLRRGGLLHGCHVGCLSLVCTVLKRLYRVTQGPRGERLCKRMGWDTQLVFCQKKWDRGPLPTTRGVGALVYACAVKQVVVFLRWPFVYSPPDVPG